MIQGPGGLRGVDQKTSGDMLLKRAVLQSNQNCQGPDSGGRGMDALCYNKEEQRIAAALLPMNVGRWFVIAGLVFVAAGLVFMLAAKLGLPKIGRLPGDIVYRGKNTTVYFPVVTCIVVSIVLTFLLSVIRWFR